MQDTRPLLLETDFPTIRRDVLQTIQVNLGYLCNLSCTHCHVNAGPTRTELMDRKTIDVIIDYLIKQLIYQKQFLNLPEITEAREAGMPFLLELESREASLTVSLKALKIF